MASITSEGEELKADPRASVHAMLSAIQLRTVG
jgi:hypothetical protein